MSEAYKRVRTARNNDRPTGQDYIRNIFRGFIEFHGDRRFADDPGAFKVPAIDPGQADYLTVGVDFGGNR